MDVIKCRRSRKISAQFIVISAICHVITKYSEHVSPMKNLCDEIMQTTRPASLSNNIPNLTFHLIDFRNKNVVVEGLQL